MAFARTGSLLQWLRRQAAPARAQRGLPAAGAAPSQPPVAGPTQALGAYTLLSPVRTGGQSALYLARDQVSGQQVALKTVRLQGHELARERFLQESAAAERLQHPHIVQTLASGIAGAGEATLGWVAMEWLPSGDLSRHTSPAELLPASLVLQIGVAVAEALHHAHAHGVVHRDLKPSNLLFQPAQGLLKIADFGCARLSDAERSRSGLILGTPGYMAPEQLSGVPVDGRCDLYALGVLLFELLTGRLPFAYASMGRMLTAIAAEPAPALGSLRPELPTLLGEVLARLLAKQPNRRHANGAELARELRLLEPVFAAAPGAARAR